jgi:peptidyl-prolyl cis-trans isomerase A (cyclophilin A)
MTRRRWLLSAAGVLAARPAGAQDPVQIAIVTNRGTIVAALDETHAPITVRNFLRYVDGKFYDGGSFFRAVPGFVIQGGNRPRERPADNRIALEPPIRTGLRNVDGAIAMARTDDPNSATSEFYICDGDQPHLDGSMTAPGYAAFGHVVNGMPLVRAIARQPAENQLLVAPITIVRIRRIAR